MIKAYHRVSSNSVLKAIMEAGRIVPAAYRLDPDRILDLCEEDVGPRLDTASPAGQAVAELIEEAVAHFKALQEEIRASKTRATALKCIDILSGDAGRVFLSPGTWSETGRALGWPLSGFVFDAEILVENGALLRKWDFFSNYQGVLRDLIEDRSIRSVEEAKERFLAGIKAIHDRQLSERSAKAAIQPYEIATGEEHLKPYELQQKRGFSVQEELVWDGPLSVDLAVEVWEDDKRIIPLETT
jgi:hypothetical protein